MEISSPKKRREIDQIGSFWVEESKEHGKKNAKEGEKKKIKTKNNHH